VPRALLYKVNFELFNLILIYFSKFNFLFSVIVAEKKMEVVLRRDVHEMITAGSNRIGFTDLDPIVRDQIHEKVRNHVVAITMDGKVIHGLLVCNYCHHLFTNAKWTMARIKKHLDTFHGLCYVKEPVGRPKGIKVKPPILQHPVPAAVAPPQITMPETPLTPMADPEWKQEWKPALELPPIQDEPIATIKVKETCSAPPIVDPLTTKQPRSSAKAKREHPPKNKTTQPLIDYQALAEYEKLKEAIDKIEQSPLLDEHKKMSLERMEETIVPPVTGARKRKDKAKQVKWNREWRARKKAKMMSQAPVSMNI